MCGGGGGGDQGPSPQEIEMQKIADEEWVRFKEQFRPVEEAYLGEIQTFDSPENRMDMVSEQANIYQRANLGQTQAGIDPNSGQGFGGALQKGLQAGQGAAMGTTGANLDVDARKLAGQQSAISLGRNIQESGSVNLERSARTAAAANSANAANAAAQSQSNAQFIGGLAGIGAGVGTNMYNNNTLTAWQYGTNPGSQQTAMLADQNKGV